MVKMRHLPLAVVTVAAQDQEAPELSQAEALFPTLLTIAARPTRSLQATSSVFANSNFD